MRNVFDIRSAVPLCVRGKKQGFACVKKEGKFKLKNRQPLFFKTYCDCHHPFLPITTMLKLHLARFPERSVTERWILVAPSLNFIGFDTTGTLTIVGLKPELSEKKWSIVIIFRPRKQAAAQTNTANFRCKLNCCTINYILPIPLILDYA